MSKFYILVTVEGAQVGHVHDSREAAYAEAKGLCFDLEEQVVVEEHDEDDMHSERCNPEPQEMTTKWADAMRRNA